MTIYTDRIMALRKEIEDLQNKIRPMAASLEQLRAELCKLESREFIKVNKIIHSDVEMSDGPGKPWFGNVTSFISWLREHSDKNWAEWNGTIYRMSDLKADRMPDTPGRIKDLPSK
jgi:hypothetical protein